jgi:ligand-binding sensor domain-containing protein
MKSGPWLGLTVLFVAIAVLGVLGREQSGGVSPHPKWQAPTSFSHFRVGDRNVKAMMMDGNILWVGTSGGVVRYDTGTDQYELLDIRSGLLANGIFHISKVAGRLAVGTYGGGLAMMKQQGGWDIYNVPEGLADAFVYSVLESVDGDVWIATWSGANRIRGGALDDPSKWDTFDVANTDGGLPNDWVYALAQGKNGEIWFATEGGLARYHQGQWDNWKHEDGLGAPYAQVRAEITEMHDPANFSEHHARQKEEMGLQEVDVAYNPNYVVALAVAQDGTVWCGTWGGGLSHFDGKRWRTYTVADGLPGNHVFMLHQHDDGQMWIGTNKGLARFDGRRFQHFTMKDGLFANNVFSMAAGGDGTLWVGSYGGVARLGGLL